MSTNLSSQVAGRARDIAGGWLVVAGLVGLLALV